MSADTVTIPAGQTSVILGVFMTDENPNLDGKELTLTLNRPPLLNPEYQVNEQDNATVTFEVEQPEDNLLFLPLIAR
jgi:hypothetical protein